MVKIQIVLIHIQRRKNLHFTSDHLCLFTKATTARDSCQIFQFVICKHMLMDRYPVVSYKKGAYSMVFQRLLLPLNIVSVSEVTSFVSEVFKQENLVHGIGFLLLMFAGYRSSEKSNRGWWANQEMSNSIKLLAALTWRAKGESWGIGSPGGSWHHSGSV